MTPEQLRQRQAQAETEYDALENEREKNINRNNEIITRLAELHGQYQLIQEQLEALTKNAGEHLAALSPTADVIDVDAALEVTKKEQK